MTDSVERWEKTFGLINDDIIENAYSAQTAELIWQVGTTVVQKMVSNTDPEEVATAVGVDPVFICYGCYNTYFAGDDETRKEEDQNYRNETFAEIEDETGYPIDYEVNKEGVMSYVSDCLLCQSDRVDCLKVNITIDPDRLSQQLEDEE